MSSNQSIDGLRRRSTKTTTVKRTVTKSSSNAKGRARSTTKPAARRQIGLDAKPRTTNVRTIKTADKKPKAAPKKIELKAEAPKNEDNEAVKAYLAEVQDVDPTDLIEIPQEEKGKGWLKRDKKDKVKKEKVKKKHHFGRWFALIILLAIVGGGIFLYNKLNGAYSQINGGNILSALVAPDTPLKKDENGRTNVLIFGTEGYSMDDPKYDGGQLTDSMMMLSFNQDTGDAKAVSLPRDLKSKTCTATSKINEVYWCQYNKVNKNSSAAEKMEYEKLGATKLEEAFEEVLGVDIQYFVHLNWQAMIQIVDAIGGIDVVFIYGDQTWDGDEVTIVTTDKRGLSDGPARKPYYRYKNGEVVHLTGEWALAVARTRNAYGGYGASGGNFSREYFQQRIIEAIVKKAKSINLTSDWGAAFGILNAVGDNVRTDFQDSEMKTLLKTANNVDLQSLESISLISPNDGTPPLMTTGMINGISYVLPTGGANNYTKIHDYLKKKLSDSFESENAKIVVLNGTSAYGIAAAEKTELENAGFMVTVTDNAPSDVSGFDGVKIFKLSDNKAKTIAALKERYATEPQAEVPESLTKYECDIIVVIGNGYKTK